MTKKDRQALVEYIRWIANEMNLRDWTIDLLAEPVEDASTFAEIKATYGRRHADIGVCREFRSYSLDKVRHIICHELAHLHLAMLQSQCENDLDELLGRPVSEVFFNGFRRNLEYAVDAIAEALAPHMPLIEWP